MTNHEGQLPNDAGEQSRESALQVNSVSTPEGSSAETPVGAVTVNPGPVVVAALPEASSDESFNDTAIDARPVKPGAKRKRESKPAQGTSNNVRRIRIELMLSKAEVARRANISVLTLDRVERGYGCRVDTKRKILEALGLSLADRVRVFGEEE